jgi:cardiolipin synthase
LRLLKLLPNILTSTRLVASPVLAWLLLVGRFHAALLSVLLVSITDWFDGYAARKLGVAGGIGVVLDPLADKTMLVTLFVALGYLRIIPRWMLYMAIGRDGIILVGAILLRMFRDIRRFTPSILGKVSTFFQIMLVLLSLLSTSLAFSFLQDLKWAALALAALFTGLSGIDYIRRGIDMTRRVRSH